LAHSPFAIRRQTRIRMTRHQDTSRARAIKACGQWGSFLLSSPLGTDRADGRKKPPISTKVLRMRCSRDGRPTAAANGGRQTGITGRTGKGRWRRRCGGGAGQTALVGDNGGLLCIPIYECVAAFELRFCPKVVGRSKSHTPAFENRAEKAAIQKQRVICITGGLWGVRDSC
jgi:hypothetical protein